MRGRREDVDKVLGLGAFVNFLEVTSRCEVHAHQACAGELFCRATTALPEIHLAGSGGDDVDKSGAEALQCELDLVKSKVPEVTSAAQHELLRCWIRSTSRYDNASKRIEEVGWLIALAKDEELRLVLLCMVTRKKLCILNVRLGDTVASPQVHISALNAFGVSVDVCADVHRILEQNMLLMRCNGQHLTVTCNLIDLLPLSAHLSSRTKVEGWRMQHLHCVNAFRKLALSHGCLVEEFCEHAIVLWCG